MSTLLRISMNPQNNAQEIYHPNALDRTRLNRSFTDRVAESIFEFIVCDCECL